MSYIVEVADDGTLTLPAEVLNHAAPHTKYVVEAQSQCLTLNPQPDPEAERQAAIEAWFKDWDALAERVTRAWNTDKTAAELISEMRR